LKLPRVSWGQPVRLGLKGPPARPARGASQGPKGRLASVAQQAHLGRRGLLDRLARQELLPMRIDLSGVIS